MTGRRATIRYAAPRRRWVLPLRLTISVAMLGVLLWRVPRFSVDQLLPVWSSDTAMFLALAAAPHARRDRAVDAALADRAQRPRPGRKAATAALLQPGGLVRVERAADHDRRRRAACVAPVEGERRVRGLVRVRGARTADRLARPSPDHARRSARQSRTPSPGQRHPRRRGVVDRHARGPGVGTRRRRQPPFGSKVMGSDGWRRFAAAVHLGMSRLRRHPAQPRSTCSSSDSRTNSCSCCAALMAAKAVGMSVAVGPTALLAFFPAVLIAQVLPISISGLGVREGAFVLFLTPLGVPTQQAIALGLLLYLLNVAVSLLGAPAFAVGGRGPRTHRCVSDVAAQSEAAGKRRPVYREVIYIAVVYLVYSTVRNHFGSAGGPPGHANGIAYGHALDVIDLERNLRLFFEQRPAVVVSRPTGARFHPVLERLLRHRALRRHGRRARVAVPPRSGAVPAMAQHARVQHAARAHRLRRVLTDAAAPARQAGRRVRSAPVDGHRAVRVRRHARGRTRRSGRSTRAVSRSSRTNTPRCRACTRHGRCG